MKTLPRAPSRKAAACILLVVAALLAGSVVSGHWPGRAGQQVKVAPPWEFQSPAWAQVAGGDVALTAATWTALAAVSDPALPAGAKDALVTLATGVSVADLTGADRTRYRGYWPPLAGQSPPPPVRCHQVSVLAASPAALATSSTAAGVSAYAKVLVAYTGTCGSAVYTVAAPGVAYVYAGLGPAGWGALRSWDVPAQASTPAGQAAAEPAEWELATFTSCSGGHTFRDRIMVVAAFEKMCAAAAKNGVTLSLTSAYRTRAEQAQLFSDAVRSYGSEQEARRWVAYADATTCTSRHCSGVALDVASSSPVSGWLSATVGCDAGGTLNAATQCATGQTPVPRMATYGFAAPLPSSPGYLEFTAPTGVAGGSSPSPADCAPAAVAVPNMVASIFRCRLAREGLAGAEVEDAVAAALVVSRCESGWNASARAFGGRFAAAANPADGRLYTEAGVFMLAADVADAGWAVGGAGALSDAVVNINAAASLWLATRGWEQFGCATGASSGFEKGPVLPEYGGPKLPDWSRQY